MIGSRELSWVGLKMGQFSTVRDRQKDTGKLWGREGRNGPPL